MKGTKKTYNVFQLASAVFMILALAWLTVSSPFVVASQQALVKKHMMPDNSTSMDGNEEEAANAFGSNTTEEKKPSGSNSLSEEYLHDHHLDEHFFTVISRDHKSENADVYTAFHGEVRVPPPNVA